MFVSVEKYLNLKEDIIINFINAFKIKFQINFFISLFSLNCKDFINIKDC